MVTDSPDSFLLGLSVSKIPIKALLDSGATHCFIDSALVSDHRLPTTPLPHPMRLRLFDGSFAPENILYEVTVPVSFAPGKILPMSFLVTPLDPEISAVIGLRWLRQYNLLVDWMNNRIEFRNPEPSTPAPPVPLVATPPPSPASPVPPATSAVPVPLAPPAISATLAPQAPPAPSAPPASSALLTPDASAPAPRSLPVSIRFVNAAAFRMLSRIDNVMTGMLQIQPSETDASLRGARPVTDSDELPQDELDALRQKIPAEFHDILNVFSKTKSDKLPDHIPQFDHHIHLKEGTHPPLGPIYNTSEAEAEALQEFLKENLDRGFIRQSQSNCGAPVLFVKKKDGLLRLCVDWRGLNKITKKDRYPIPLIPNLLDRLRDSEIYTKIDLQGAYNLIRIAPGDEWKTAFHTRYSSFDFMVMHFSLTNAPATFQRFMNSVFSDVLDKFVVVYLDDILIFSKNPEEHKANVREVLLRLQKHNLYTNPDKCEFSVNTTEFLGYVISPSGISMSQSKVDAILKWPAPKNVKQIQSFLGFANFYRRFIFSYSDIVIPLTRLMRKGVSWDWSNKSDAAFRQLKQAFTKAPVLTHWSPDYPMLVETDTSDYALAGIISGVTPNGEIHPIAFHSRTFTDTECNYDTHDKELLAIFESFKVWHHYLEGSRHHIDVVTDHKNLEYFSTTKMLSRRQARWSEYLSAFQFTIRFRPGKLGAKPDALTRRPDVYPKGGRKTIRLSTRRIIDQYFPKSNSPLLCALQVYSQLSTKSSKISTLRTSIKTSSKPSRLTSSLKISLSTPFLCPPVIPFPTLVFFLSTTGFMFQTPALTLATSVLVFSNSSTIIPLQAILVKIEHSSSSDSIILGLTSALTLRTLLTVVSPASETRTLAISHSDLFNNFRFHLDHGIPSLSTSLNSSLRRKGILPFSTSSIAPVSSSLASRHTTRSTLQKLPSYSFTTYSPSMVFRYMSPATAVRNLLHNSSDLLERCSTSSSTSPRDIIRKPTASLKELTRHLNSTSDTIARINKTTGPTYSRLPNLLTITLQTPRLVSHLFSPIKVTTPFSTFTQNAMLLHSALVSSQPTLMNFTSTWPILSSSLKNNIKFPPMSEEFHHPK
jgi:hypothetical protein